GDHDAVDVALVEDLPEVLVEGDVPADALRPALEMGLIDVADGAHVVLHAVQVPGAHPAHADVAGRDALEGRVCAEDAAGEDRGSGEAGREPPGASQEAAAGH